MLKLIKTFIFLFIVFYIFALFIYFFEVLMQYKSTNDFIFDIGIFKRIFPNAIFYGFAYIALSKLCVFLGLTGKNEDNVKDKK